jgi:DNA-binding transcriptional regulator YdaS (Cro superfamily)
MELETPIRRAASAVGNPYRLARLMGLSHVAVAKWLRLGRPPAERCLEIERLTGVSRYELRPDIYGPPQDRRAA